MNGKLELKTSIILFNESNKDKIIISFGSPFGKNKYLFLDYNKIKYNAKQYFKTYREAITAIEFLELYQTVKEHKGDQSK